MNTNVNDVTVTASAVLMCYNSFIPESSVYSFTMKNLISTEYSANQI